MSNRLDSGEVRRLIQDQAKQMVKAVREMTDKTLADMRILAEEQGAAKIADPSAPAGKARERIPRHLRDRVAALQLEGGRLRVLLESSGPISRQARELRLVEIESDLRWLKEHGHEPYTPVEERSGG